jgi:cellulose synthase/poly-beta-1,6-N-acetylglucosamine synthase-like glycosyltransferase/peptidoglycan/xylan/chitin deacetylase (PgdA/CDA1 family)
LPVIDVEHDSKQVVARPVFFDPHGRRWTRVQVVAFLVLVGLAVLGVYLAPRTVAPLWRVPYNGGAKYPATVAYGQSEWPSIGTGGLVRVVQVKTVGDRTFVVNPFTGATLRELGADDREVVRSRSYALERYGGLPPKTLALAFQEGPDYRWTPEILDLLSAQHVSASFFDTGVNMTTRPDLVTREAGEGHLVGNLSLWESDITRNGGVRNRLMWTSVDRISRVTTGIANRFALVSSVNCSTLGEGTAAREVQSILTVQQLGYLSVCPDYDSGDWGWSPGRPGPLPNLDDGVSHVVALHDEGKDRSATVIWLRQLLDAAHSRGYTFTTVAPLAPKGTVAAAPVKVRPAASDHAVYYIAKGVLVLPQQIVTYMFLFNIMILALVTFVTPILAFVTVRRERRRTWPTDFHPFVSVVIPAYNEELTIGGTLASIARSTYADLEAIVINDGSTDDTLAVLRQIAEQWEREGRQLRVLNQPNLGKWAALNNGFRYANSDIVVTGDADTIFMPTMIQYLVRHFHEDDVGAVVSYIKVGNNHNLLTAWQSLDMMAGLSTDRLAQQMFNGITIVPGAASAWRRGAVLGAGGYTPDTLVEDQDTTIKIHKYTRYRIVQENKARAVAEEPDKLRQLLKQRFRWTFGGLQVMYKHRDMLFRRRYHSVGMFFLPYNVINVLVPLVFMPITYLVFGLNIASGNWRMLAIYATIFLAFEYIATIASILIVGGGWWHLWIVPLYRPINEPMRIYLMLRTIYEATRGQAVGWNPLKRTGGAVAHLRESS